MTIPALSLEVVRPVVTPSAIADPDSDAIREGNTGGYHWLPAPGARSVVAELSEEHECGAHDRRTDASGNDSVVKRQKMRHNSLWMMNERRMME